MWFLPIYRNPQFPEKGRLWLGIRATNGFPGIPPFAVGDFCLLD
jgi:hypothetical protein